MLCDFLPLPTLPYSIFHFIISQWRNKKVSLWLLICISWDIYLFLFINTKPGSHFESTEPKSLGSAPENLHLYKAMLQESDAVSTGPGIWEPLAVSSLRCKLHWDVTFYHLKTNKPQKQQSWLEENVHCINMLYFLHDIYNLFQTLMKISIY